MNISSRFRIEHSKDVRLTGGNDKVRHQRSSRQILRLKKDLNAIILAHNYQRPEVQDIVVPCSSQEVHSRLYSSGR